MRRNLTLLVAATTTAVVLALVIPLALLVGRLAQDRAIAAATQQAQSVALLIATDTPPSQLGSVLTLSDERSGLRTSVVLATGTALGPPVSATDLARARGGESFTTFSGQGGDGAAVYLPVAVGQGTSVVRVGVTPAALSDGVASARISLVALAAGLVAASLIAAVVLARRITAPLLGVAEVAHDLRRGDLGRRVEPGGPPEVQEVGTALNQLAGRIGELLQAEREAAADLSHRLRTPVTALRLAVDTTGDEADRARLREHLDRLEGTVDSVVRQARRPATGGDGRAPTADLAGIVAGRAEFWGPLAEDQHRALVVQIGEVGEGGQIGVAGQVGEGGEGGHRAVWVPADPQDITDVVDVLLDNVFAHTEPGVDLALRVETSSLGTALVVEDDGPGLPDLRALGRGRSSAGSTGLGLDIVARVAAASGATLDLGASARGGTRVSVTWPAGPR